MCLLAGATVECGIELLQKIIVSVLSEPILGTGPENVPNRTVRSLADFRARSWEAPN